MASITLNKVFKSYRSGKTANQVIHGVSAEIHNGEFVVVVHALPAESRNDAALPEPALRALRLLLAELPTRVAVRLATELTGASRNALYAQALAWKQEGTEAEDAT